MSSILKVDTIQTTAGAAPTTKDLGFAAGSVIQVQSVRANMTGDVSTSSTSYSEIHSTLRNTFTPKFSNSKIILEYITSSYGWSSDYIYFKFYGDGSDLDPTNDMWRNRTGAAADAELSAIIYLEIDSWGTSSKVISPYFKANGGSTVYANWSGNAPSQYMKVTEISQ